MTCLSCIINTTAADDLVMQRARASAVMILTSFSQIILVSAPDVLMITSSNFYVWSSWILISVQFSTLTVILRTVVCRTSVVWFRYWSFVIPSSLNESQKSWLCHSISVPWCLEATDFRKAISGYPKCCPHWLYEGRQCAQGKLPK